MINTCKDCAHFKEYTPEQKALPFFNNDGYCCTERCLCTTRKEGTCDSFIEREESNG